VPAAARAPAAVGVALPRGRRGHPVRHGQGKAAYTDRVEPEVVGLPALTSADQSGTPEHGRAHQRRAFQANPRNAVVVRQWQGREDGPGGTTVFLTKAAVAPPLQPFDDDDERRLIEHCGSKEAKPPWDLGHPPQKTARAVRVQGLFPLRMVALAPASRQPCERAATGGDPIWGQRWRRPLLEQTRAKVLVCAPGYSGIVPLAEEA
jgi:hypothetical protein